MIEDVANARIQRSKRKQEFFKANGLKQISVMIPLEFETVKKKMGVSWRVLIARGLKIDSKNEELKAQLELSLQATELLKQRTLRESVRVRELEDLLKKAGLFHLKEQEGSTS